MRHTLTTLFVIWCACFDYASAYTIKDFCRGLKSIEMCMQDSNGLCYWNPVQHKEVPCFPLPVNCQDRRRQTECVYGNNHKCEWDRNKFVCINRVSPLRMVVRIQQPSPQQLLQENQTESSEDVDMVVDVGDPSNATNVSSTSNTLTLPGGARESMTILVSAIACAVVVFMCVVCAVHVPYGATTTIAFTRPAALSKQH